MLAYLSSCEGIGGRLVKSPETFIVEEIMKDGKVLEVDERIEGEGNGEFTHFVLQKRNWNTLQALKVISSSIGCSLKRFGYAGTKDRRALTVQLCSVWRIPPERIMALRIRDIRINGAWSSEEPVRMGDLLGNRFTITISDVASDAKRRVKRIMEEVGGRIPNYFGEQRFGTVRMNTHIVGREIIRGNFKGAVLNYLCFSEGERMEESAQARERLSEEMDFKAALGYFPRHLKYERTLLSYLSVHPRDYVNALRRLPRGLSLMFVHAYQSYLFNEALSMRIKEIGMEPLPEDLICPADFFGFPDLRKVGKVEDLEKAREDVLSGRAFIVGRVLGYETKEINEWERRALEKEDVNISDFLIRSFPEISSKGTLRALFVPLKGLEASISDVARFGFSLPAGSYATVALREFMKVGTCEGNTF